MKEKLVLDMLFRMFFLAISSKLNCRVPDWGLGKHLRR
jgi:hypothetical protein